MSALTFDTLKFVKTLEAAGVPESQAEAFSTAVRESHEAADVATRGDIADLRHEMKELETGLRHEISDVRHEIGDLRKDMDVKLVNLKFELLKWLIGIAIAQTGLLLAVLRFFPINS